MNYKEHKTAAQLGARWNVKKLKCQIMASDSWLDFWLETILGTLQFITKCSVKRPSQLSWDRWIGHFGVGIFF